MLGSRSAILTCHFGSFRRVCGDTHHLMQVLDSGRKNPRRRRAETPLRIEDLSGHHLNPCWGWRARDPLGGRAGCSGCHCRSVAAGRPPDGRSRSRGSVPSVQLSPEPPKARFTRLLGRQGVRRAPRARRRSDSRPNRAASPAHCLAARVMRVPADAVHGRQDGWGVDTDSYRTPVARGRGVARSVGRRSIEPHVRVMGPNENAMARFRLASMPSAVASPKAPRSPGWQSSTNSFTGSNRSSRSSGYPHVFSRPSVVMAATKPSPQSWEAPPRGRQASRSSGCGAMSPCQRLAVRS